MQDDRFREQELAAVRRSYARQVLADAGVLDEADPRLLHAFSHVARENYLGPPPWQIVRPSVGYFPLPGNDPALVYQDALFALIPERGINNGSPSLHARWLHEIAPRAGDRIVHIGAGTGYYTAILAELASASGHVVAVEFEPSLAAMAKTNLAHLPNVTVIQGDGAEWPQEATDCIYVNFSVERPADAWIEQLAPGGRLVFPLGVAAPRRSAFRGRHSLSAAAFKVVRMPDNGGFAVTWLGPVYFVCAEGALSVAKDERNALRAAFERGGAEFVRSLRWKQPPSPNRTWFAGSGWSLSYEEAGS